MRHKFYVRWLNFHYGTWSIDFEIEYQYFFCLLIYCDHHLFRNPLLDKENTKVVQLSATNQIVMLHNTQQSRRKYYCYNQNTKYLWCHPIINFFQYCNIGLFSIAHCTVITLNPLCILLGISSLLLFYGSLSKVITLPTIAIVIALSLLKAIARGLLLLFANAFKSIKERKLLLSQQLEER